MKHRYWTALVGLLLASLLAACGTVASPPATAPSLPAPPAAPAAEPAQPAAGLPVRLSIPAIAVDAAIEPVGQTPQGAMDVPRGYDSTGWYQYGPRPGEPGSAVITGHVDSPTAPAVFWDLRSVTPGVELLVETNDGVTHRFVVTEVTVYPREELPLDRIFERASGTYLNLITCDQDSPFDKTRREYGRLLVVYADAAP